MSPSRFSHKGLHCEGISEGGIRTSLIVPTWRLMFDIGVLPIDTIRIENLLLTHGHLDHSIGVPYYISQRSLQNLKPPNVYLPDRIYETYKKILSEYEILEGFQYRYNLHPVTEKKMFDLSGHLSFQAFPTHHRVPSLGYTIYEKTKKLKKEYIDLEKSELIRLKENGVLVSETRSVPMMSFSGDTRIEYVLENEDVRNSKILVLECTYLDSSRDVKRAREWGHIHLDEIVNHADEFENEKIVLIHFSKRYHPKKIPAMVEEKLPDSLKGRVHCFLPDRFL